MAKYRIIDNQSGKTVIVSGEKAPTPQDAETIFAKAGLRSAQPTQPKQKGVLDSVTDFLMPRSKDYFRTAIGSSLLSGQNDQLEAQNTPLQEQASEYMRRAQAEKDPVKQRQWIDAAKALDQQGQQNVSGVNEQMKEASGLDALSGATVDPIKKSAGLAGEVGSYMMPSNALQASTKGLTRVAGAGLQGAGIGALLGATDPQNNGIADAAVNTAKSAVLGGVAGGAVQGLFEVGRKGAQKLAGDAADKLKRVIRPTPSNLDSFQKNTGMDYAKELLKRDGKNIEGMGYDQLVPYFADKYQASVGRVDEELAASGKTVSKEWMKKQFTSVFEKYKDRPVASQRVGQDFATYYQYLDKLPDNVDLATANQIKRDLQELASSAYGNTSNSVPKAYKAVAAKLRSGIEDIYPAAKELNAETQLYRLTSDAVLRTYSREQNKISTGFTSKMLQSIPGGMGAGVGIMTGNPLAGLATMLASAGASKAREVYRSPQIQTRIAQKISGAGNPTLQAMQRLMGNVARKGAAIGAAR